MTVFFPGIALLGLLSGWVMGTSAAGWGALTVPLLILAGVEPLTAISSSLAASVVLSLFGGVTHWRYDRSRVAPVVPLVIGGMGGAFLGTLVSPSLPTSVLRLLIGVSTVIMGLLTVLRKNGVHSSDRFVLQSMKWHERRATLFGIGTIAGVSAGAFGTGWGPIGVALLMWTGIPPHTVVGSSLLARTLVAVTATGSYAVQWYVAPLGIFLPLLVGGAAGIYLGVRTSNGLSAHGMRKFLGGMVSLVGALTIVKSLW